MRHMLYASTPFVEIHTLLALSQNFFCHSSYSASLQIGFPFALSLMPRLWRSVSLSLSIILSLCTNYKLLPGKPAVVGSPDFTPNVLYWAFVVQRCLDNSNFLSVKPLWGTGLPLRQSLFMLSLEALLQEQPGIWVVLRWVLLLFGQRATLLHGIPSNPMRIPSCWPSIRSSRKPGPATSCRKTCQFLSFLTHNPPL